MLLKSLLKKHGLSRVVLASGSPRRKEILIKQGGLANIEIVPSTFEENLDKSSFAEVHGYVEATARGKALQVAGALLTETPPPDLVIGADTVVTLDNKIFEKPVDRDHAYGMLSRLNGRAHTVVTGVVILLRVSPLAALSPDARVEDVYSITSFHDKSDVLLDQLSEETISDYLDTGESMDKAGAYGIQMLGGQLVNSIAGDFYNVMGFPLHTFWKKLQDILTERGAQKS